jgi:transcriptional regulator with XRE-family HTH domain
MEALSQSGRLCDGQHPADHVAGRRVPRRFAGGRVRPAAGAPASRCHPTRRSGCPKDGRNPARSGRPRRSGDLRRARAGGRARAVWRRAEAALVAGRQAVRGFPFRDRGRSGVRDHADRRPGRVGTAHIGVRAVIPNPYLSQIERGRVRRPDVEVLSALSELYSLDFARIAVWAGYLDESPTGSQASWAVIALPRWDQGPGRGSAAQDDRDNEGGRHHRQGRHDRTG